MARRAGIRTRMPATTTVMPVSTLTRMPTRIRAAAGAGMCTIMATITATGTRTTTIITTRMIMAPAMLTP